MKNLLRNRSMGQSLLSLFLLCVFTGIALGSLEIILLRGRMNVSKEYMGSGNYKETEYTQDEGIVKTYEGRQDAYGRWQGQVKIKWNGNPPYTEEATMEHGVRQGPSTRTYPDGHVVEEHYLNGIKYELKKAAGNLAASAFQRLEEKYPWYLFSLNGWGFDDEYVKGYLDTIETRLNALTFEPWEFDDFYDDVITSLQDTPLDTIIEFNTDLMLLNGFADMKNSELRLAVIDCYRSEGNSVYNIINTTYPGYLVTLNDSGVINMDFEVFCQDLEDSLESYGPFDPEDPFYTDTVDSRLFMALVSMLDMKKSLSALPLVSKKGHTNQEEFDIHELYQTLHSIRNPYLLKAEPELTSSEVAASVLSIMLIQLYESDIIRRVVRETYLAKTGIIGVPTTATEFVSNNSSTSAIVDGYILEDGGAAVYARGIAWATHYNPTTGNNTEIPDAETGHFSVTLSGLTTGTTYYARTFATNSKGTGYGNCITFVADVPVGMDDKNTLSPEFRIHPNPASEMATFSFNLDAVEIVTLTIINTKGQVVLKKEPGTLHNGENEISLNLSGLAEGVYTCRITNGKKSNVEMFVIAR
jgi:hypothetical protein